MRSFIYLFFSRFNYSKGHGICAFLLPEILSFQGSAHLLGVGSFSHYIALADRWMPQWYIPKMSKMIISGMEKHFQNYQPDIAPKDITSVPGKLQKHSENTCRSRYVWLPIEWQGEKPVIRWRNEWMVEDL